jgi:hypothetical protein
VLNRLELLRHILAFTGAGAWAYVAPVSRIVKTAYMAAMFNTHAGLLNICRGGASAATESMARLEMALVSTDTSAALSIKDLPLSCVNSIAKRCSGSVTEKLLDLGMEIRGSTTIKAATHSGSLLSLESLRRHMGVEPVENNHGWEGLRIVLAARLAEHGAKPHTLAWLSQLQSVWPEYTATLLCHIAAQNNHLDLLKFFLDKERTSSLRQGCV